MAYLSYKSTSNQYQINTKWINIFQYCEVNIIVQCYYRISAELSVASAPYEVHRTILCAPEHGQLTICFDISFRFHTHFGVCSVEELNFLFIDE